MTISGNCSGASLGRDQLERQPERLRPAGLAARLLPALGRARQPDAAALRPARVELAAAELPVELDRVHHHPRQRDRRAQLADEPGGVERRAARELVAVEQHDVAPAELGEVVGDRRPADAAADDHAARARRAGHGQRHGRPPARSSKRGSASAAPHAGQVLARVGGEVEVELGDAALHDAPHALAEVGHDPHQPQRGEAPRRCTARPSRRRAGARRRPRRSRC